MHTNAHTYINTYTHTYIYMYIYTHTHTNTYTHAHTHIYICIHTHTHKHYIYIYTHTCAHTYTHTHTYSSKDLGLENFLLASSQISLCYHSDTTLKHSTSVMLHIIEEISGSVNYLRTVQTDFTESLYVL